MNGGVPFGLVLSVFLPDVRVDAQHFQGCFQSVFEAFFLLLWNALLAVAQCRTVSCAAVGVACELHDLPIVAETASR